MDADLQDPIELLPEFVSRLSEGFDVVYAKHSHGDSFQRRLLGWVFTVVKDDLRYRYPG